MDKLIRYVCIAPEHQRVDKDAVGDLTVHSGSWAFCPAEVVAAHIWSAVGELDVAGLSGFGLRRRQRAPGSLA